MSDVWVLQAGLPIAAESAQSVIACSESFRGRENQFIIDAEQFSSGESRWRAGKPGLATNMRDEASCDPGQEMKHEGERSASERESGGRSFLTCEVSDDL